MSNPNQSIVPVALAIAVGVVVVALAVAALAVLFGWVAVPRFR